MEFLILSVFLLFAVVAALVLTRRDLEKNPLYKKMAVDPDEEDAINPAEETASVETADSKSSSDENAETEPALKVPVSINRSMAFCGILMLIAVIWYMAAYMFDQIAGIELLRVCSLLILCIPVAWIDLHSMRIPNSFIVFGLVMRLVLVPLELIMSKRAVMGWISDAIAAGALLIVCLICSLIIKNAIGMGDVKLLIVTGLFLGIEEIFNTVMTSLILFAIVSVVLLIRKKITRKDALPYGPFLALSMLYSAAMIYF